MSVRGRHDMRSLHDIEADIEKLRAEHRAGEASGLSGKALANAPATLVFLAHYRLLEKERSRIITKAFPFSKGGTVVEMEGHRYRISYHPETTTKKGKVTKWGHTWSPVASS